MFSVVVIYLGLFPVSRIQLMSSWAGAGREHSQTTSSIWSMEIFHTMYIMFNLSMGLAKSQEYYSLFDFLGVGILSWLQVWTFFWAANQSSGKTNIIACGLFFIFIIIIGIIITIISIISGISFVALSNSFYLNSWVFPFFFFSSPSGWGGRVGVPK